MEQHESRLTSDVAWLAAQQSWQQLAVLLGQAVNCACSQSRPANTQSALQHAVLNVPSLQIQPDVGRPAKAATGNISQITGVRNGFSHEFNMTALPNFGKAANPAIILEQRMSEVKPENTVIQATSDRPTTGGSS